MELDELLKGTTELNTKIEALEASLNIAEKSKELSDLEAKVAEPEFWSSDNSEEILSKIKSLKQTVSSFKSVKEKIADILDTIELLKIDPDKELEKELNKLYEKTSQELDELEIKTMLSGKYDNNPALVTIHPGAGGTEAMDWAAMLYRMYSRWCEDNGFTLEELDYLDGEEAGLKSVTFRVTGEYAYGHLKAEHGVHRLVRISPFDAGGRRHTSFASVEVLPEIDDENVTINPDDIKMDVYRASGAGGQHVNKTSSAVRLTHIPTGIVVSCQTQRSQFQNRDYAMKMLLSKLINLKESQNKERIEDLKGNQMDIAWGSQIRSYVFCPYTLVKDHRTEYEVGNVQKVMDGDLNEFIHAYLKSLVKGL